MIVIDLKIILFIVLLLLLGLIWLLIWNKIRHYRRIPSINVPILDALSVAPFGVLVLEGTKINFINEFVKNLLHISPDNVNLPDADWVPLLMEDCAAAHKSGGSQGRYRIVTFPSGKTARWWVIPHVNRDIIFVFDITSQIRTEQTGRTLVNDLGHELRNPVATLLTHLEVLGLTNVGEETRQQSLYLARAEAQRMGRLINDMLDLGRLEVLDNLPLRPINILPLVNEVILQSTPSAQEKNMTIKLATDSNLPLILGNGDRLRQVFLNLVDNAIKYSSSNNNITINIAEAENGIHCSVCDNGPGIASENLPHITRRFYRAAPESVEGSGLGLALVKEILRRHNSELKIESPVKDNQGTCMHFFLPNRSFEEVA